eukprot:CAMPEP_0184493572 /NCGR_PEP_ID=MMETSP0113_2-20130426/26314_1 /TAXON_ID=91329 /ORGANISM="Norrisiella sphaerica, Strain BC52" /LENGTH=494 /DNA_ID=CAMNT_0026878873 /DNA_START=414 /DNA_END=1898 /DNA_ORIENTATION=+
MKQGIEVMYLCVECRILDDELREDFADQGLSRRFSDPEPMAESPRFGHRHSNVHGNAFEQKTIALSSQENRPHFPTRRDPHFEPMPSHENKIEASYAFSQSPVRLPKPESHPVATISAPIPRGPPKQARLIDPTYLSEQYKQKKQTTPQRHCSEDSSGNVAKGQVKGDSAQHNFQQRPFVRQKFRNWSGSVQPKHYSEEEAKLEKEKRLRTTLSRTDDGQMQINRWLLCNNCDKWRRIPLMAPFESLWNGWTCRMAKWKPLKCSVEEELPLVGEKLVETKEAQKYYRIEKSNFDKHLASFLESFDVKMRRTPTINSRPLDLYRLYREVVYMGGCDRVVAQEGCWTKIFRTLDNYSIKITDASYRLKRYYKHYLYAYEQHFFFGKPLSSNQVQMDRMASQGSRKRQTKKAIEPQGFQGISGHGSQRQFQGRMAYGGEHSSRQRTLHSDFTQNQMKTMARVQPGNRGRADFQGQTMSSAKHEAPSSSGPQRALKKK